MSQLKLARPVRHRYDGGNSQGNAEVRTLNDEVILRSFSTACRATLSLMLVLGTSRPAWAEAIPPTSGALNAERGSQGALPIHRSSFIVPSSFQLSFTPAPLPGADKLISLNFVDADVRDVLAMLSQQSGLNIVVTSDVQGRITIGLNKVPFEEALQTVVKAARLKLEQSGSTYIVTSGVAPPGPTPTPGITPLGPAVPGKPGTVSLNAKDADLRFLVDQLINQAGVDVMIIGDLAGKVTIRLSQKPFEEALSLVLAGTKYSYNKFRGIYVIGDPTIVGGAISALTSTEVMRLRYIEPKEVLALLPPSLPPTFIKIDERANALLVTGTPDFRRQVRDFLDTVDIAGPQVMLETTVLELSKKASRELGLSFAGGLGNSTILDTNPPGAVANPLELTYSTKPVDTNFLLKLRAFIQNGEAKIKANPKVAAASGREAMIDVSRVINVRVTTTSQLAPISTIQSIEAGVKLKITPYIGLTGEIITRVSTEVSSISGFSAEGLPEVSKRVASTVIRLKSGETLTIGGLIQSEETDNVQKIPILGDIPLIGTFFRSSKRNTSESELIIMITPRILNAER